MPGSIELVIKDNLEKYATYDNDKSLWSFYYGDLYELINKVLGEYEERYFARLNGGEN